jgi:hypothetical protein
MQEKFPGAAAGEGGHLLSVQVKYSPDNSYSSPFIISTLPYLIEIVSI